jgi:hypothetical protein
MFAHGNNDKGNPMRLIGQLFSDDVGIMSALVILGVIVIGAVLSAIVRRKMNESPPG